MDTAIFYIILAPCTSRECECGLVPYALSGVISNQVSSRARAALWSIRRSLELNILRSICLIHTSEAAKLSHLCRVLMYSADEVHSVHIRIPDGVGETWKAVSCVFWGEKEACRLQPPLLPPSPPLPDFFFFRLAVTHRSRCSVTSPMRPLIPSLWVFTG